VKVISFQVITNVESENDKNGAGMQYSVPFCITPSQVRVVHLQEKKALRSGEKICSAGKLS